MRAFLNPAVERNDRFRGLFAAEDYRRVDTYFAAHPELTASPLKPLPDLAVRAGIRHVDAKDETHRFGLTAFKILGVQYAVDRLGEEAARAGLVCATAGNHGRAVARVARQKSVPSTIFVPAPRDSTGTAARTRARRVEAMTADGATVVDVDGSYEDAVRRAADHARETGATLVSDTSWDGYEQIPRWIMAGYTRMFDEARSQWASAPDIVVIQGGVGGLVCAAASWFSWWFGARRPFLIASEPENAACLLESARAGKPTHVGGDLDTIMSGLRCADPSIAAWPAIARGIDAFITVDDPAVLAVMETLSVAAAAERIDAGPSGACGAAALIALGCAPELADVRAACRLDRSTRALIVLTEGA